MVHDVPLLVEKHLGPSYHLVVIVGADERIRLRRLMEHRGMTEDDVIGRMAAQATDEQRRAAADVWLDNSSTREDVHAAVDALWHERLVPFEHNVRHGIRASRPDRVRICPPDVTWPAQSRASAGAPAAGVRRHRGGTGAHRQHVGPGDARQGRDRRAGRGHLARGGRPAGASCRPRPRRASPACPGSTRTTARTASPGPNGSTPRPIPGAPRTSTCARSAHRGGAGRCSSVTGCAPTAPPRRRMPPRRRGSPQPPTPPAPTPMPRSRGSRPLRREPSSGPSTTGWRATGG